MSNQYDNTNRGALFNNDRRNSDRSPDMTGSLNVDGVEYFISAWYKDTRSGTILSLSVTKKDNMSPNNRTNHNNPNGGWGGQDRNSPRANGPRVQNNPEPPIDFDDDIPF
ncbi:hypothetical protein [Providencia phage Kokobel2]|nr:hypothetical protein [Providencia phage Kokobel2]